MSIEDGLQPEKISPIFFSKMWGRDIPVAVLEIQGPGLVVLASSERFSHSWVSLQIGQIFDKVILLYEG